MILTILLSLSLLIWIAALIDAIIGFNNLNRLEEEEPSQQGPKLSIIVAARNEEKSIEHSIKSQFLQKYEPIEWILVNDRSVDQTGKIMDNIQKEDSRAKVIHIEALPAGWLGKNHALHVGSKKASGELLLFTDADVIFKDDAIGKAVQYFTKNNLDHLTAAPNLNGKRFWLRSFIGFFLFGFSYYKRPWLANRKSSKTGMGIGAFNLVSKEAYKKLGTHETIKMRPDDDLMLGMLMKQRGFNQRIVTALNLLEVEWYGSLREAFIGLEKNTFAGLHYRMSMVLLAITGTFFSQVLPFFTLLSTDTTIFLLSFANVVVLAVLYSIIIRRMTTFSPSMFLVFPITALLFIYSIIRASFLTFVRGGIVWRGTKYRLSELREKK
ncbi:glycosyltransferase family 2 protein (plasmid) [Bacillus sp. 31A1R]|uniref:4,4'-diaponeurosporenoate glycosyltransferase n=1 Tax=Robertmurraya mangrovi TaxID=3098077 RepID=A0ABU5IVB6_9BACI|nr:glycosyltransferase family 2 protein [Bacillus sp. 31A1R]MDZ5471103.1 glycosyltransferase family 2 protein [Bacillus sp. 31A1R]